MHATAKITRGIKCRKFSTFSGAQEYYITATAPENVSFREAIDELTEIYRDALLENDLDSSTQQFTRFYFSDVINEYTILFNSELFNLVSGGSVSFVQQSPLGGKPLGILSYHIKPSYGTFQKNAPDYKNNAYRNTICTVGNNYSLLWSSNYNGQGDLNSEKQTQELFSSIDSTLSHYGYDIKSNTVRTWIFVRDIDNYYGGMVKARRELFQQIGLSADTRYIASTGIEGKSADPHSLVTIDALSIGNIKEEQIIRMEAPKNLSKTIVYGVTFDRGTRLRFGDRSHLYISGTASINSEGKTIHIGDVRKQTMRTIDNIEALLEPHGATLEDMQYMILYLRNPKQYPLIEDILSSRIPENTSLIAVEGAVCRTSWLVEMEGVAITPDSNDFPPFL